MVGVGEEDIAKTDGKTLFYANPGNQTISIVDAKTLATKKTLKLNPDTYNSRLYLQNNRLVVISQIGQKSSIYSSMKSLRPWYNQEISLVSVYDVSNPSIPKLLRSVQIDGTISESRLIENDDLILINENYYQNYGISPAEEKFAPVPSSALIPTVSSTSLDGKSYKTQK